MASVPFTNFLGLMTDDTLTSDNHVDQLTSRLNFACYTIRAVESMCQEKL